MSDLHEKHCQVCEGGVAALTRLEAESFLKKLEGWVINDAGDRLYKEFKFKNYYHTMAFVNAVAFVAHREGHHPDMEVSYNKLIISYQTHAINGLSENDFICAAKVDQLG